MAFVPVRDAETLAWLAKTAATSRKSDHLTWNPSNVRVRANGLHSVATVTNGLWLFRRPLWGSAIDPAIVLPLSMLEGPLSDGRPSDEHNLESGVRMVTIDRVQVQTDSDPDYPHDETATVIHGEALSPARVDVYALDVVSTAFRRLQCDPVEVSYNKVDFGTSMVFILRLFAPCGTEAWLDLRF